MSCSSVGELTAEHREWVTIILKAAGHLLACSTTCSTSPAIEAGNLALSLEPIAVEPVIADALDAHRAAGRRPGRTPGGSAPLDRGRYVLADRQRLRQVLINLLSNAVKYNHPAGTVSVVICPAGDATGTDGLRVAVTDTGRGISPDSLGRLFTPFERLDAAQAGIEGTGLGLALSRQLVHSMGGAMGVTSTVGAGATFWIELPAAVTLRPPSGPRTTRSRPATGLHRDPVDPLHRGHGRQRAPGRADPQAPAAASR